jgi:predicted nuclease with TOPRIM domain
MDIKFSEQELEEIKQIQAEYQTLIFNLGQLEIEKRILESKQRELDSTYQSLNNREQALLGQFTTKYGPGTLDLTTGTFTSNK